MPPKPTREPSYLKQRGNQWWFQIGVPKDVRAAFGKALVAVPLGTTDKREARGLASVEVVRVREVFARLRGKVSLTSADIEGAAREAYQSQLAMYAGLEQNPSDEDDDIDTAISLYGDALRDRRYALVAGEAAEVIGSRGATVAVGSPVYNALCAALCLAHLEAFKGRRAFLKGQAFTPRANFTRTELDPLTLQPVIASRQQKVKAGASGKDGRFSTVASRYVDASMRDATVAWSQQTKAQYEATFRLFEDYVEDCPLASVMREDAASFLDAIATLNPSYGRGRGARQMSFSELLQKFKSNDGGLGNKTLNRHLTALNGLWKWARTNGVVTSDNPFSGLMRRVSKNDGWVPFNLEELNALFGSTLYKEATLEERLRPKVHTMKQALLWAPIISLYCGLRSNEICQLRPGDVAKEDGVWRFNVSEEGENQELKTDASVRKVPVHSKLIECGFLKYLKHVERETLLFPGLKSGGRDKKYNTQFVQRFFDLRMDAGITRNKVVFHSFRKNVGTALERARVPESEAVQILGHEKLSMSYSIYSIGLTLPQLSDVVEKIAYPNLNLRHLAQAIS